MNGKQSRTARISVALTPDERVVIEIEAEIRGITISDILMEPWRGSGSKAERDAEVWFSLESTPTPPTPYEELELREMRDSVRSLLVKLTPREDLVLRLRFGITSDGRPRTNDEIAQEFGVTNGRVYQIEAKAMRKLRHLLRTTRLRVRDIKSLLTVK